MEIQLIHNKIHTIRGHRVMLDFDLADYKDLKERIEALENEMKIKFKDIHQALNYLLQKDKQEIDQKERKRIGFKFKV